MRRTAIIVSLLAFGISAGAQDVFLPSQEVLQRPFGDADVEMFASPDKIFYPEVWVDCLCGNMSEEGILADLEAIKAAGFSGVQFFFGVFLFVFVMGWFTAWAAVALSPQKRRPLVRAIVTFPIFSIILSSAVLYTLVRPTKTWKPIPHGVK